MFEMESATIREGDLQAAACLNFNPLSIPVSVKDLCVFYIPKVRYHYGAHSTFSKYYSVCLTWATCLRHCHEVSHVGRDPV